MAHILLIEDSPTDRVVFTRWLEHGGHVVTAAASAEDGLDIARRDKPDLIMMDVVLPGMSGFQATRALSRDLGTKAIPVLMVSTKGMEIDQVWGRRQGAAGYLVKPPREDELLARVNHLVGAA